MSPSTPTTSDDLRPRRPLGSQKNAGGDMSMMFFVQSRSPRKFAHPDQYQIKGLNAETIARVIFSPPTWITATEYTALRTDSDADTNCGFFSLNMSIYNQTIDLSEWDSMWFFIYGRVHPYALTWQVEPDDGLETADGLQNYTIPALIVRDQGYQPWVRPALSVTQTDYLNQYRQHCPSIPRHGRYLPGDAPNSHFLRAYCRLRPHSPP
jgi:hypothetical protein